MAKYLIEGCCDGSLFAETIVAGSQEEAEEMARLRLCEAWGDDPAYIESLDDLGDAASVTEYSPEDYARDAALPLLAALEQAEWGASVDMETGGYEAGCPICGAAKDIGHNVGCDLAAALAAARGEA